MSLDQTALAEPKNTFPAEKVLLDAVDLQAILGVSRTTLWRMTKAGEFPNPIKITANLTRWHRAEVDQWIADKAAEPRQASIN